MKYSFFIALLYSSFLVSSLEAMPRGARDGDKKISRSSKRAHPKANEVSAAPSEPTNPFQSSHLFGLNALRD